MVRRVTAMHSYGICIRDGGPAEDAFDVVILSMPGYAFSARPTATGWRLEHIARAWEQMELFVTELRSAFRRLW